MTKRMLPLMAVALLSAGCATLAAAETPNDRAMAHFNAIANSEVASIVAPYADDAVFQWVGGPLDGTYRSKADITGVWQKFTKAQGKLKVEVADLRTSANPAGATVSANVKFVGKATVPVRYVLTYRGDRLVNEVWQIDPKLGQY